jgi:hypothetical protein
MTMTFLANGYSVKYMPIAYSPRAGRSKFHWWSDTRRYLLQIIRMVLLYNPVRVFVPPGMALLGLGVAKLVFDVFDKSFRVATGTLVVLLAAGLLISIGLLADVMVQLNRRSDEVAPATRTVSPRPGHLSGSS